MTLRPRALLLAATAALVLAACGSADDDRAASGEAWSYTSGDGETYTADEVPTRIIAQAEAAAALIAHGIKPVGIFLSQPLEDTKSLEGVDLDGIEIIGETWGKIDAEKAAALRPDLIVSGYWTTEKAYGGLENGVEESSKKVGTLAPVVGPVADQSVEEMLDGFEELSATLGADLDAPEIAADKRAFEDARDRFQETVAQADGLTAMAVSPAADVLYVAVPKHSAELADFSRYGLDIIVPKDPDPDFSYWENLSWENADRYQPDLVLMDDRTLEQSTETAEKQPTWRKIEAVEAGAVTPWPAYWISTYRDYAEQLDRLGDAVEKADPDLT
jgi:iron complex transport system substrate-binding protein